MNHQDLQTPRVVICRSEKDGLIPFYRRGYTCAICLEPIQISANGLGVLTSNPQAVLVCNECGLLFVKLAQGAGCRVLPELSPDAKKQMDAGNDSELAKYARKASQ